MRRTILLPSLFVALASLTVASRAHAQPCTADDPANQRYCGVPLNTGFGGPNDFGNYCLSPNDDSSSSLIDITPAFPSGLNFFGTTHTSMYVNTNGNISFSDPVGTFTPEAFPVADQPMIAPYWADVDIRGEECEGYEGDLWSACMLAPGAVNGVYWWMEPGRIVVTWDRTGYFGCNDDRKMSFQLIITRSSCGGPTDFDVEFRYAQCEWTTGDASGGTGGFGGTPGQAGFDAGNSTDFVEIAGSRTGMIHRILCEDSNVGSPGVYRFQIRSGSVVCPDAGVPCTVAGQVGACAAAHTQCYGGGTRCQQEVMPSPERCDGIDNDCDGETDEDDDLCSGTDVCDRGSCIPVCFEGGCDVGFECVDEHCIETACVDVTCADGQRCEGGACVDACAGVTCPDGLSCRSGRCVDLCETITCDDCSVCDEGTCVVACNAGGCPSGELCVDGRCEDAACIDMTCDDGFRCEGGDCIDACEGVTCPRGDMCERGACVPARPMMPDAGPVADGGAADAGADGGPAIDAGSDAGCRGPSCGEEPRRGCSCSVPGADRTAGAGGLALLALVLGAVIVRRRR